MSRLVLAANLPGKPVPQGSMTLMTSRSTGRPFGKYNSNVISHRNELVLELQANWGDRPPLTSPVELRVDFCFDRPKSHYRTGRYAGVRKDSAPQRHIQTPDVDKLCRLIGDALTIAGVLKDDKLICNLVAAKYWATTDGGARTLVQVVDLEE